MTDKSRDPSRLVDHFKRLYTIVVGLAITEACRRLLPFDPETFSFASFWMFCTFVITVVPIFQGGDRSLDLKYLSDNRSTPQFWFIWDVFMLIIMAMLFVVIAESIPSVGGSPSTHPLVFFEVFGFALFVDAILLGVDQLKSHLGDELESYAPWICMNVGVAIFSALAGRIAAVAPDNLARIAFATFAVATLRSFLDYKFGRGFMFPEDPEADTARSG